MFSPSAGSLAFEGRGLLWTSMHLPPPETYLCVYLLRDGACEAYLYVFLLRRPSDEAYLYVYLFAKVACEGNLYVFLFRRAS